MYHLQHSLPSVFQCHVSCILAFCVPGPEYAYIGGASLKFLYTSQQHCCISSYHIHSEWQRPVICNSLFVAHLKKYPESRHFFWPWETLFVIASSAIRWKKFCLTACERKSGSYHITKSSVPQQTRPDAIPGRWHFLHMQKGVESVFLPLVHVTVTWWRKVLKCIREQINQPHEIRRSLTGYVCGYMSVSPHAEVWGTVWAVSWSIVSCDLIKHCAALHQTRKAMDGIAMVFDAEQASRKVLKKLLN